MSTNNAQAVLAVLTRHIGRNNGINMRELEKHISLGPRRIRLCISELREDGHAICGTPDEGYFIAATAEELEHTCEFLRSRAMHSLTLESRLRKIPLPDLIGQLHVPT